MMNNRTCLTRLLIVVLVWSGLPGITSVTQAEPLTNLLSGNNGSEASTPPDKVISINHSKQNDKKIETRLQQIFSELDELKAIKTTVSNGVVTLQGEVASTPVESKALQFANQVENVVEVKNQLQISHSLQKRINNSLQKMQALGEALIVGLPLFLVAMLLVIFFWLVGRWCSRWDSLYRRISVNYFIADLLAKLIHLFFIVIGIISALILLDATALIGTVLGAAGIFGLAIGFAVRDTVENFITSLLLSLRNPFEVNDFVSIDGHEGTVARLTSRATILISADGNHIRIPNATVYKSVIVNYTCNPERRFQFEMGIDTAQDLLVAQGVAFKTLSNVQGVLEEPKPMVLIQALGESNVLLQLYAWVDQRTHALNRVQSEAIRQVKQAFDEANIGMPEPIYTINISHGTQKSLPATAEKQQLTQTAMAYAAIKDETDEVKNVTVDRNVEHQIEKENAQGDSQNLLTEQSQSEL